MNEVYAPKHALEHVQESEVAVAEGPGDAASQLAASAVSRELCLLSASILLHIMQIDGRCRGAAAGGQGNATRSGS